MPEETTPQNTPVSKDPLARFAEQQSWISPKFETFVQSRVTAAVDALGGEPLRNFMYGQWMHTPLHAALTDVPIGSWTATVACDAIAALTGSSTLNTAADAANMVGLAAASITAITGLNDWSGIDKPAPRRIGLIHGLLNITATGLFLTSCFARRRQDRGTARALAVLGYVIVVVSSHLGGSLVYEHGIGVDLVPEARQNG